MALSVAHRAGDRLDRDRRLLRNQLAGRLLRRHRQRRGLRRSRGSGGAGATRYRGGARRRDRRPRIGGMTTATRDELGGARARGPAERRLPPRRRPHRGGRGARRARLRGHRARPRGRAAPPPSPRSAAPASTGRWSSWSSSAWCSGSRSAAAPPATSASTRPATTITTRSAATAAAWSRSRTRRLERALGRWPARCSFDVTEHDVVSARRCERCARLEAISGYHPPAAWAKPRAFL